MSKQASGITIDMREADKRFKQVQDGLTAKGLSTIGKTMVRFLRQDMKASITGRQSPAGVPWRTMKSNPGWAPLQHTGQLINSADPSYKNFGATLLVQGAIKSGYRSGGARRHGEVAGVQHFGRKKSKYGGAPARKFMGITRSSYAALLRLQHRLLGNG